MIVRGYYISKDEGLINLFYNKIKAINEDYKLDITPLPSLNAPYPLQLNFVDEFEECSFKYLMYEYLITEAMENKYNFHIEFDIRGEENLG